MASTERIALDSSAVIVLASGNAKLRATIRAASEMGALIFVPAPVLAETLRGTPQDAPINQVIKTFDVVPTSEGAARLAGGMLRGRHPSLTIDALICATALDYQADAIFTQDVDDHERLLGGAVRAVKV